MHITSQRDTWARGNALFEHGLVVLDLVGVMVGGWGGAVGGACVSEFINIILCFQCACGTDRGLPQRPKSAALLSSIAV
jgi:hypothetical protein